MATKSGAKRPGAKKAKKPSAAQQVLAASFGLAALYIVLAHATGAGSIATSAGNAGSAFVRTLTGR